MGYIPFEGRLAPYPTDKSKFHSEINRVNLQPVNKITYSFDPFTLDHYSLRVYMYFLNAKKPKATGVKTIHKTNILDDRSSPNIKFDLNDGRQLEVKTGNLSELEIASIVNNYVLPLVKDDVDVVVETKASKGAAKGGKGGIKKGKR